MITEEKKLLRQKILAQRSALTPIEVEEKSALIAGHLLAAPEFAGAAALLIYLPIKNEVLTQAIIAAAWENKKTVLIPVCLPARKLLLSRFESFDEVVKGAFDILEPRPDFMRPVPAARADLAVLPGLAFNRKGQRLGYGGGYFDNLLPTLKPGCRKIALAYDFQLVRELPTAEHDAAVDIIITESGIHPASV